MNATILVIEDEDETREIFLRCLTFENFNAIGAKEGAKGIELAKVHRPDLIVCDIMMPEMDGYGVLKAVRRDAHLQTSPFIFLTAKVTMEDLRQGMALGADDYLAKPCTIEQFLSAIATRLQRKQEIQRSLQSATPQHTTATTPFSIFPDCPKLAPVFQFIDSHYQQPIHLSDVAQAAAKAVTGDTTPGIYELGGPEVMTFGELMNLMRTQIERKRPLFDIPMPLARIIAFGMDSAERITGGMIPAQITPDQVRSLQSDNVVSDDALTFTDLGITPTALLDVLPDYLWKYRPGGNPPAPTHASKGKPG